MPEAVGKTSLKYMNTLKHSIGHANLVWCDARFDIMSVQKAGWNARLMHCLVLIYVLQTTRARFDKNEVDVLVIL